MQDYFQLLVLCLHEQNQRGSSEFLHYVSVKQLCPKIIYMRIVLERNTLCFLRSAVLVFFTVHPRGLIETSATHLHYILQKSVCVKQPL